ncbi:MAG: 30S ribosomal protein S6 [Acidobacteria bacterium]|nr:30S ribosomal protein S6 [Acidobacteriota bacterium]
MRTYELMYISAPNTAVDDISKLNTQLEQIVSERGGTVTRIEDMGRRNLAYRINKFDDGIYTLLYVDGSGVEIAELERRLRVTDFVIRHITVRTDEDMKRAAKMKAKRKSVAAPRDTASDDDQDDDDDGEDLDD